MEEKSSIFESVKNSVVGTIRGTGDVAKAVVDTVSGTLAHTIKGTGAVGTSLIEAVSDVGRAAIRGVSDIGGDVGSAAKNAVVGIWAASSRPMISILRDDGSKDANGKIHVPIDKAMDTVVSRLRIQPNAPSGITTPGGEGRAFAGSINNMPPAYRQAPQAPQIQGEIRKRAQ